MIFKGQISSEALEAINRKLKEDYGSTDGPTGELQNFRLIWVDSLLREIRLCSHSVEGFEYTSPRYEERRKYNYIDERYVLEKLAEVPITQLDEITTGLSYEPLWVFQTSPNSGRQPLYPKWQAIHYIIENLFEAGHNQKYYKKPIEDEDLKPEIKARRINALMNDLYGNETEVTDALAYREAIVVPNNYKGGE